MEGGNQTVEVDCKRYFIYGETKTCENQTQRGYKCRQKVTKDETRDKANPQ